jgi:acyl-CoA dehydrogenase
MSDLTELASPPTEAAAALREGIRTAAAAIARRHPRTYWLDRARSGGHIPEMWAALAEAGLIGVGVPEDYGGAGGGVYEMVLLLDELARAGVPSLQLILTGLVHAALARHANPDQVERYLKPSVAGRLRLCLGVTEPDAGTNTFAIRTTARRAGDGYVVSGQKTFISGADEARFMYTVVRSEEHSAGERAAFSVLMIPLDAPGVERQRLDIEIVQPEYQFTVFMNDVQVGGDAVVGAPGAGGQALFDALNAERLLVAAMAGGLGYYALEKAVAYARERRVFGRPIGAHQALQHRLARARAHLEAARLTMYAAASAYDRGEEAGPLCAMAKYLAAEAGEEAANSAIQAHGGYAFDAGYDVASIWPLVRLFSIAPINNEMILNFIGERILGLPKSY